MTPHGGGDIIVKPKRTELISLSSAVTTQKKGNKKMTWQDALDTLLHTALDWLANTGIKLVIAILILIVSFKVINYIGRRIEKAGTNGKFDKTLSKTLAYILKIGLKCLVAICMVGYLGIDTSGLAAVVTSFGVCAGLALNGALANLAGGVMIILTRPFKVDDYIEALGYSGTVEEVRIVSTKLRTPDNKVIYLPNGTLSAAEITNYSEKDTRRVDFTFSIAYNNNFEDAKAIIKRICDEHELIMKDPEPAIRVSAHGASSIDISTRVWTKSGDYWTVYYDLLEMVKLEFDKAGIEIPFNQLDVHVKQD